MNSRKSSAMSSKKRFVLQEFDGETMHVHRVTVDVALRVDVAVELAAGGDAIDDLDAAKLDQAVAVVGIEPRRLGIHDDLAQHFASLSAVREHNHRQAHRQVPSPHSSVRRGLG